MLKIFKKVKRLELENGELLNRVEVLEADMKMAIKTINKMTDILEQLHCVKGDGK